MKIAYAASVRASESAAESMGVRSSPSYFEMSSDADGIGAAYTVPASRCATRAGTPVPTRARGSSADKFVIKIFTIKPKNPIVFCGERRHVCVSRHLRLKGGLIALPAQTSSQTGISKQRSG